MKARMEYMIWTASQGRARVTACLSMLQQPMHQLQHVSVRHGKEDARGGDGCRAQIDAPPLLRAPLAYLVEADFDARSGERGREVRRTIELLLVGGDGVELREGRFVGVLE